MIAELQRRQGTSTQTEYARMLGVSQATLSRIYAGERRIGMRLAKRLAVMYPDLIFVLAAYLLANDGTGERMAS